jgi:hypothetical protein
MKKIVDKYPLYLLIPVFFYLHNFNELPFFIRFDKTMRPFLVIVGVGMILLVLWRIKTKPIHARGVPVFFLWLFLFYFGVFHDWLKFLIGKNLFTSYKVVVPLSFVAIIFCIVYLLKRPLLLRRWAQYLSVLMIVLLVVETITFFLRLMEYKKNRNLIDSDFSLSKSYWPSGTPYSSKPDIYFLVFDEYTSGVALNHWWKYDNSGITNWLKKEGFYLADSSCANYNFTPYSLSASLNMRYIDAAKGNIGDNPLYILQAVNSVTSNETTDILQKENYTFFYKTPLNNGIENLAGFKVLNKYPYMRMYESTLFYRLQRDVFWHFSNLTFFKKSQYEEEKEPSEENWPRRAKDTHAIIKSIKSTADTNSARAPKFVFGHLLITHQPHLFDSMGNYKVVNNRNGFDTYLDQVRFANKVMKDIVSHIKEKNKKNTIIIVEGDHGFRDFPKKDCSWQFPNLHAFYFPDSNYRQLYPTISPVNGFRVVFNRFFDQHPLLKDTSVYVKNIFYKSE